MKTLLAAAVLALAASFAAAGDPPAGATDEEAKAANDAIAAAVKAGDLDGIKSAIKSAGECRHAKVIAALQGILASGNPDEWRIAAAADLGRMSQNADAAAALNGSLEKCSAKAGVFDSVCNAIQDVGHRSSIGALAGWCRARVSRHDHDDLAAIDSAIDALASFTCKAAVEAVMDLWQKCKYSGKDSNSNFKDKVADNCRKAMRRLTGEKNDNYKEWDDWWEHTKDKLNDDLSKK